jgi:DNA modification methylase
MPNALYYGDNLEVLRKHLAAGSVDLIYLDPPFNSNQDYNILFKEQSGEPAQAQMRAFTDTWEWSEKAYVEFCEQCPNQALVDLVQGFVKTLGRNDVTAYLVMMAPRLVELHRVLKATGSLYLHCDSMASHHLKIILDSVFGPRSYLSEIIWKRTSAHSDTKQGRKQHGRIHDVILFYTKGDDWTWNPIYTPYDESYIESTYKFTDEHGRRYREGDLTAARPGGDVSYEWRVKRRRDSEERWVADLEDEYRNPKPEWEYCGVRPYSGRFWAYSKANMAEMWRNGQIIHRSTGFPQFKRMLDEQPGVSLQDLWTDIKPLSGGEKERLGYPTQKPLALLERIIESSSNKGDVVLDPFCGCGTAVVAAQKLKRKWIGIDITHLAIALIKYRLSDSFRLKEKRDYDVIGEPTTAAEAEALALQDRDEFHKWAVGLVPRAFPFQDKKGADTGIDGILRFRDDNSEPKKNVIQVKSGKLTLSAVRDFAHVIDREKATLGLFITLDAPTKPMQLEADKMGFYTTPLGNRKIPRFQIRTVEQLLNDQLFDIPQTAELTGVKTAAEIKEDKQIGLL